MSYEHLRDEMQRAIDLSEFVQANLVPNSKALQFHQEATRSLREDVLKIIESKGDLQLMQDFWLQYVDRLDLDLLAKEVESLQISKEATAGAKSTGSKVNFETLATMAKQLYPQLTDDDVMGFLLKIREQNDGSLKGLSANDVMAKFTSLKEKLGNQHLTKHNGFISTLLF